MNYHLARNGQQLGTCSHDEAIARYARGEILPTDLVWCEGMPNWAAASTVFGAAVAATPPAPTPPPFTQPLTPPPAATPVSPFASAATGTTSPVQPPKKPDSFLVWSILATLLCCLPGGIVAIVYSTQVDSKYTRGDYAGAEAASKNAKMWVIISAAVGVVVTIGAFIVGVAQGMREAGAGY